MFQNNKQGIVKNPNWQEVVAQASEDGRIFWLAPEWSALTMRSSLHPQKSDMLAMI